MRNSEKKKVRAGILRMVFGWNHSRVVWAELVISHQRGDGIEKKRCIYFVFCLFLENTTFLWGYVRKKIQIRNNQSSWYLR